MGRAIKKIQPKQSVRLQIARSATRKVMRRRTRWRRTRRRERRDAVMANLTRMVIVMRWRTRARTKRMMMMFQRWYQDLLPCCV